MKLEKYVDQKQKRRKEILISISVIVLISVSLLLYKTFASFTESAEFQVMNGKVDYFGNSDVYFAFYKGDEQLEEMPQKGNKENLVFDHGTCDNGAAIEWNSEEWGPMVKNLSKSKTKCSIYFKEKTEIELDKDIPIAESGDGLYTVPHNNLEELGTEWNKTEYRYAGVNPDNYVKFNNELWRIIGLVNVKTDSGIEQRIKIIRQDGIQGQKDLGNYSWDYKKNVGSSTGTYGSNDWTDSQLKDMLNGIYYNSSSGDCLTDKNSGNYPVQKTCDFSNGAELPKGLDEIARTMVDSDVIWNIGGWSNLLSATANQSYEYERGTKVYSDSNITRPTEWSKTTDVGNKHNGIGLIYLSDYGYSVGGNNRENCLSKYLMEYSNECINNIWLKPSDALWTLSPCASEKNIISYISLNNISATSTHSSIRVWPTLYLKSSIKIKTNSNPDKVYGSIDNPFILTN